ncbi:MAG: aminotransferase, partial [Sedimentibacter sp.]|nr:aminotransferase [Sedimentibacter sp.]
MAHFAKRMKSMENSAYVVKKLFGAMNDSEIISFGGGAPAREALPVDIVREISNDIMRIDSRGIEALQYGPVMGTTDLREVVVNNLLAPKGVEAKAENIIITGGGMEAINLLCQLFIDPDDIILVESPSFVHSVEVFEMFQAKCIPVSMDENGM